MHDHEPHEKDWAQGHRACSRRRWVTAVLGLAVLGLVFACNKKPEKTPETKPAEVPENALFVRHILVRYAGTTGAEPSVHRTKAGADSLAHELLRRARAGENFAELAKKYSDDPSATEGGEIAPLEPGDAPEAFLQVAAALRPGEISEVLETSMGYHIILRRDIRRCTAQHILIRYKGAVNCPDSIVRSRAEALTLAERILADVRNPEGSFPVAAMLYSDDTQTSRLGGYLGTFMPGQMDPNFDKAAFALQEQQISDIVETPYGFHIIRRIPDQKIRVAHILVTYAGVGQLIEVQRTRDAALKRAMDADFRAKQGEDFAALAQQYSDDEPTAKKGGTLPPFRAGQTVPEFEDAAFRLKPGEVSDVVETMFGFHVIKRLW